MCRLEKPVACLTEHQTPVSLKHWQHFDKCHSKLLKKCGRTMTKAPTKTAGAANAKSDDAAPRAQTMSAGRVTRNPFLNFLRDMRKNTQGMSPIQVTRRGAEIWRNMTRAQKEPYCQMARQAERRPRRLHRRRRSRQRKRRRH